MSFFSDVKSNVVKGFDWGVDAASQVATQAKDGVVNAYTETRDGISAGYQATKDASVATYQASKDAAVSAYHASKGATVVAYQTTKDASVAAYEATKSAVVQAGRTAVNAATVSAVRSGGAYLTSDAKRERAVKTAIDKRADYKTKEVCQACAAAPQGAHPNANDGKFMGDSCALSSSKPSAGKLPEGCGAGCKLPKIYFTNGINNDEEQVCKTITAIAEMQCAEVVGIFNATYADPATVKAPVPSPWRAPTRESPPWYRPDQLVSAAVGDKLASITHGLAERVGTTGLMMDVLDCLDNIDSAGTEAAAKTQKDLVFAALSADPPQPITLYAHSQGGLITQEGLVMARQKLYGSKYLELTQSGAFDTDAGADAAAARYADARMKLVSVTSFGTAETGWTPGPIYAHYTNTRDPVPELIKSVQSNRPIDPLKTGGPVTRFTTSGTLKLEDAHGLKRIDPMAAHGMAETYLPKFAEQHTAQRKNGKCCD